MTPGAAIPREAIAPARCDVEGHCITCGDEGKPMTVLRVDESRDLALCADAEGVHCTVEVALLAHASAGDRVLVHAGTAIARLDAEEAGS
jgi:hydrogenase maturation factor